MSSLRIDWENKDRQRRQYSTGTDIFIVHGHNEISKLQLETFLFRRGLRPIILHEQPNRGMTLIEKLVDNAKVVGYAIVMLTRDDKGCGVNQKVPYFRARQKVILELGYFLGFLGRDRVCCIYEEGVELPSDMFGIVHGRRVEIFTRKVNTHFIFRKYNLKMFVRGA